MEKGPVSEIRDLSSLRVGATRLAGSPTKWVATSKQLIVTWHCSIINCRARSTLRAPFRMAVPPVLSSTSAEYSLQEVEGCTMIYASVSLRRLRRVHVAYLQVGLTSLDCCIALALDCRIALALDCRTASVCLGKGPCRGKRAGRNVARARVPRKVMTSPTERIPNWVSMHVEL